jgi:hypothetical protein
MASVPGIDTKLICLDTAIVDLAEQMADPVEVHFGVQLGGGTDINAALAYCERKIEHPAKTHLVLITDLNEGGDSKSMLARVAALKQSGVNVIVLLALSDDGDPGYHVRPRRAHRRNGLPHLRLHTRAKAQHPFRGSDGSVHAELAPTP